MPDLATSCLTTTSGASEGTSTCRDRTGDKTRYGIPSREFHSLFNMLTSFHQPTGGSFIVPLKRLLAKWVDTSRIVQGLHLTEELVLDDIYNCKGRNTYRQRIPMPSIGAETKHVNEAQNSKFFTPRDSSDSAERRTEQDQPIGLQFMRTSNIPSCWSQFLY